MGRHTPGGLGRVCATGMYRSIEHVKFPKFQTGIFVEWKAFGPTDRNDQTGHSGPPSKLVPNIPVGPNRNGPFHLMYQPK